MAKKNTGKMTSAEFAKARAGLGLSQHKMAEALGVTYRLVQYYEKDRVIPKKIALAVRYLCSK